MDADSNGTIQPLELGEQKWANGKLLIQVWAMKQPKKSRRKFTKQNNLIEFNSPNKKIMHWTGPSGKKHIREKLMK